MEKTKQNKNEKWKTRKEMKNSTAIEFYKDFLHLFNTLDISHKKNVDVIRSEHYIILKNKTVGMQTLNK